MTTTNTAEIRLQKTLIITTAMFHLKEAECLALKMLGKLQLGRDGELCWGDVEEVLPVEENMELEEVCEGLFNYKTCNVVKVVRGYNTKVGIEEVQAILNKCIEDVNAVGTEPEGE